MALASRLARLERTAPRPRPECADPFHTGPVDYRATLREHSQFCPTCGQTRSGFVVRYFDATPEHLNVFRGRLTVHEEDDDAAQ